MQFNLLYSASATTFTTFTVGCDLVFFWVTATKNPSPGQQVDMVKGFLKQTFFYLCTMPVGIKDKFSVTKDASRLSTY